MTPIRRSRAIMLIGGAAVAVLFVASLSVTGGGVSLGGLFGGTPPSESESTPPTTIRAVAPQSSSEPEDTRALAPQTPTAASVLDRKQYVYRSLGRDDPFKSLVSRSAGGDGDGGPLGGDAITLVGILEVKGERLALVEDPHGNGYVLGVGDSFSNSIVTEIGDDSMEIRYTSYGVTERRVLRLARTDKGGRDHAGHR